MKSNLKGKLTISVEAIDGDEVTAETGNENATAGIKIQMRMRCGDYGTKDISEAGPAEYLEQGPIAGVISALAEALTNEEIMHEVLEMVAEKVKYAHERGHCPDCKAASDKSEGLSTMPVEGHA